MSNVPSSSQDSSAGISTDFARRPPSQSWEMIRLADSPKHFFWLWFKPANYPQGFTLRIPDETYREYPHRGQLTMRRLLQTVGIEPSCVTLWYLHGEAYQGMSGTNPSLDQPVPDPIPGIDPNIHVYCSAPQLAPLPGAAPVSTAPVDSSAGNIFDSITLEWTAALKIERDLSVRRKQLNDMLMRLGALNRDLSSDEQLLSDSQDKVEWQDARRWLREVAGRVSRYIKDHDIGEATSVAKRAWIEQIYEQYIVPRQHFDGIEQMKREYGAYHKLMLTLLNKMNTAYATASQEGERRAQMILSRIAAKVRSSRSKR